jgi:hypothetical protein
VSPPIPRQLRTVSRGGTVVSWRVTVPGWPLLA